MRETSGEGTGSSLEDSRISIIRQYYLSWHLKDTWMLDKKQMKENCSGRENTYEIPMKSPRQKRGTDVAKTCGPVGEPREAGHP